ncbi:SprT family zinc-dependent metalloprotease [Pseudoalteromonas sp. BZB3]|uniref:M48 family metallopeptidase n=1 Tax=Pseudoalteromonas sp. BZB3 TaxID=3136670 RepID=UPI0032C46340
MFDYQLKLSKRRKTVAIKVTPEQVVVTAPENVCEVALENWLKSKKDWVHTQRQKLELAPNKQKPLQTRSLLVFGSVYKIEFSDINKPVLDHESRFIYLPEVLRQESLKFRRAIIKLLTDLLSSYLELCLEQLSKQMNCHVSAVKIREYKSRWGSCSNKQALTFNSLLAGAPKHMIDYVIVHELAHCHVLAHNTLFWQLVEKHYEDYKSARLWFNKNGKALMIE